jgi:tol-pal system protein YbgF
MKRILILMGVVLLLSGCMKQIRILSEAQMRDRALREADSLRINRLDEESMQLQRRLLNVDVRTSMNSDDLNLMRERADSIQTILDYHASLLSFHTDRISTVLDAATDDAVKINDIEKRLDTILEKISTLEGSQSYTANSNQNEMIRRLEQKIDQLNERISYLENTNYQGKPSQTAAPKAQVKPKPIPISNTSPEMQKIPKPTPLPKNLTADQLYQVGYDSYVQHDPDKSVEAFVKFTKDYPNHPLIPNAYYWIAEISYDHLNFGKASEQFEKVVTMFPTSKKAPEALVKEALCLMKLNKKKEARTTLVRLINTYPSYVQNNLVTKLLQKTE